MLGEVLIPVKYQNQQHNLPANAAMVVKSPGPNLLGRDWLQVIKLNWNGIFNIQESNPQLQKILQECVWRRTRYSDGQRSQNLC